MNNSIYPCIWFNNNAKEAAEFYASVFDDVKIFADNPTVVIMYINGQKFMLLNGGSMFKPNVTVSFMMMTANEQEVENIWNKLMEHGKSHMELNSYPWSKKYGWVEDKFGVNWQLYTGAEEIIKQKFSPTFMFTGNQNGNAEKAIHFYTKIFPNSNIQGILKYSGVEDTAGNVQHAQFDINSYTLMCMDSSHEKNAVFTEGVSMVVECDNQNEIDKYWDELIADGGKEGRCGWLKDKFEMNWQIIPSELGALMNNKNSNKVMEVLLTMNKIIVQQLKEVVK